MFDLVIKGATVVNAFGRAQLDIGIKKNSITALETSGSSMSGNRVIDAAGLVAIPGLIDTHVHLGLINDFKDDCISETQSALAGGITTLVCHLIFNDNIQSEIDEAISIIETEAYVEAAFHLGITSQAHVNEIPEAVRKGIRSFKFYMGYKGQDSKRIGVGHADDGLMYRAFKEIAKHNALGLVHAENWDLIQETTRQSSNQMGLKAWMQSRPDFSEAMSIDQVALLSRQTDCKVGIVHVSSKLGVESLKKATTIGTKIFGETCPQYLSIDSDSSKLINPLTAKITPPVRTSIDIERLWKGIKEGLIRTTGTDHCTMKLKDKIGSDIWSTRPGFPGLETALPVLFTKGVVERRITLEEMVAITSYNNAKTYGIPKKGCLLPGFDADIVLFDPDQFHRIKPERLTTASDFTPWSGWNLAGVPKYTVSKGVVVFDEGRISAKKGGFLKNTGMHLV